MRTIRRLTRIQKLFLSMGVLAALLLALLLGEILLRALWPQPPRGFSESLFTKRDGLIFLLPRARGRQYSREFSVSIAGNDEGYRDGAWPPDGEAEEAAWIFGDSFAFGWGVEAKETTAARLNALGLRTASFAMPGDGLTEYRARLARALATGAKPAAIFFLIYDNDFSEAREETRAEATSAPPEMLAWRHWALQSHLLRLLGRGADHCGFSAVLTNAAGYQEGRRAILARDLGIHRSDTPPETALRKLLDALAELLQTARQTGAPVCLMRVVPVYAAGGISTREALSRLGTAETDLDLSALDRSLAEICLRQGCSYLPFCPSSAEEEKRWYYRYDMHLTATGQALLARRMAAWLSEAIAGKEKRE